jgi:hypothetical protein
LVDGKRDISGVLVVDEYLSTDATSAITDLMVRGVHLTADTSSAPVRSTSLTGCTCNAGWTGPDGGRNMLTTGSAGTIINGIVTSTTKGGGGNCELAINQLSTETSDWQLSKVYVWNVHLPDAVFAKASAKLNSYRDVLNSMEDPSIFLSFV